MKTKFLNIFICTLLICLTSCEDVRFTAVTKEVFSGYVQKGPYINGSSVAISELDDSLNQTGRVYSTTITGNSGSFEQKQIELVSNYVQLKADGYYFNEVSGETSSGQLSLYALADISQVNSANVNVLTHLEKSRVEYLVQQKGLSFQAAKKQAQTEVLAIFSLALPTDSTSESLNLSADGDNNAILLAVSCILQGSSTTAEMSELMANIISDIKTDGTLDNASLGSMLFDNARLIDLAKVRSNMEERYVELGIVEYYIPNFEKQVQSFLSKSTYTPVKQITYPNVGNNGPNILSDSVTTIKPGSANHYSMKANLPAGTSLKIIIKGGSWFYVAIPSPVNWTVSTYNLTAKSQEFTVIENKKPNDISMMFEAGNISIEYYENGSTTPTRVKQMVVENPLQYIYPFSGDFGVNVLNDFFVKTLVDAACSMKAEVSSKGALKIVILGGGTWKINGAATNWTVEDFFPAKQWQVFTVTEPGKVSDLPIVFTAPGMYKIEYHENNDLVATRVKEIVII